MENLREIVLNDSRKYDIKISDAMYFLPDVHDSLINRYIRFQFSSFSLWWESVALAYKMDN
jgi:hypothetical protein